MDIIHVQSQTARSSSLLTDEDKLLTNQVRHTTYTPQPPRAYINGRGKYRFCTFSLLNKVSEMKIHAPCFSENQEGCHLVAVFKFEPQDVVFREEVQKISEAHSFIGQRMLLIHKFLSRNRLPFSVVVHSF